jgi:hypothetical protein
MAFRNTLHAKGKGWLILGIGALSFASVFVVTNYVLGYFKLNMPEFFYQGLAGVSLLLAGGMSWLSLDAEDTAMNFDNNLMLIPVTYWPYLYAVVGLLLVAYPLLVYYKLIS